MPGIRAIGNTARGCFVVAVAAMFLALAASASADTIAVNTTVDENGSGSNCSLREALGAFQLGSSVAGCTIVAATGTDTINLPPTGTIDIAGHPFLNVSADVDIVGPGPEALTITNSLHNTGLIGVQSGRTVSISGVTIEGGKLTEIFVGGGSGIQNSGDLTLTNVRMVNNDVTVASSGTTASVRGGAIRSEAGSDLTLDHTTITGSDISSKTNTSPTDAAGSAVYSAGTLAISSSTIEGNNTSAEMTADGSAYGLGAVYASGAWSIDHTTISGNTAVSESPTVAYSQGAGLWTTATGTLELSTVANNTGTATGDALAAVSGSGIYAKSAASVALRSVTIAGNGPLAGDTEGANFHADGAGSTAKNSIIADPRGAGSSNCDGMPLASLGFNDDFASGGPLSCVLGLPTDIHLDPLLGDLADNGGPTKTMLPDAGGPVIDKGSSVGATDATHDQRGFVRPSDFGAIANEAGGDGSDMGAVEIPGTPGTPPGGDPPKGGQPPVPTGAQAAALKKCKKKKRKARKKCRKRAAKLPV